ncbi:MAG: hypothetical protein ACLFWM_08970, partial [Actinomycetota bacterium]
MRRYLEAMSRPSLDTASQSDAGSSGLSVGTAVGVQAVASITVLTTFGAANAGTWEPSPYLLIPPVLGFLFGAAVVIAAQRRGGHLEAAAITGVVVALLTVGGGRLVGPAGPLGAALPIVMALPVYRLTKRLYEAFPLTWLTQWVAITLVLINAVSIGQAVLGTVQAPRALGDREPSVTSPVSESTPDVAVLILDEMGSPRGSPFLPTYQEMMSELRSEDYQVQEAMWSSYPISDISIPSILDGSYPMTEDDDYDRTAVQDLALISQGDSRLVSSLQAAGYRFTMVESGLWMSSCGPRVDVCVANQPVNETLGVVLSRSSLRWWYRTLWGDAFIASGLRSMEATRQVLTENAQNGRADLTISHIMLPHFPYLLDEECRRSGRGHNPVLAREDARTSYG